ncbi:MAG: SUMF1/EgtB/PvdO family nonheme iron enzyme [Phycisphaerae bacterium]
MEAKAIVAALAMMLGWPTGARATVNIETVPVGDPCNAGQLSGWGAGGFGPDRLCGAVDCEYRIGKYEVSNAEYCAFLNAVASVGDPHGLYDTHMGGGWNDTGGISRTGSGTEGDPWVYSSRPSRADRPVNYVSFWDACRFANWLHNDQRTGAQDLSTTEDGAYFLNGVTDPTNTSISRELDWKWAVTSEDEWYKAAYYDPGRPRDAGYWGYPTGSDTAPTAEAPPGTDMTNGSASYYKDGGYVDPTYYTTECGAYDAKPSDSPYGTFDQGGNVFEWNEAIIGTLSRGVRGGSFRGNEDSLHASNRDSTYATNASDHIGFRVSEIPEPATLLLICGAAAPVLLKRRRS